MARALRPTSLLLVLVPGETPPDEALVRASLEPGAEGSESPTPGSLDLAFAEREDFERAGGSPRDGERLWEFHVELGGAVFRIAAERAPPLHEWHVEQARWSEGEREAAEAATWALSVEGRLEDPPLRSLRDQLGLALALGCEDAPAIWDESSLRLWPASSVRRMIGSKAGLGVHELASLHSIVASAAAVGAETNKVWVHTHGLARAGVADLDAVLVPRSAQDPVGELLHATASLLLEHGTPAPGAPFPVGEAMEVVLLRVEDALARLPADAPGGGASRDEDHRESTRLVVAPATARGGGSPSLEPLVEAARKGPFFRSSESTERMRLLARERWGEFVRLFHQHRSEPGFVFLVKVAYEPDRARERPDDSSREHLWIRVKAIEDDRIEGILESSPLDIAALKKGEAKWHDLERLTEWLVVTPAGRLRPDSAG